MAPDKTGAQATRRATLWWAYLIAPVVGPVLFAVVMFFFGTVALALNPHDTGTPIGVLLVPALSLTVGVAISYFVAGIVGMPIIFQLERRQSLNGYTIHGTALACLFACVLFACVVAWATSARLTRESLLGITTLLVVTAPFVLASGTMYWWIASRGLRGASLRTLLWAVTFLAILLGITAPFLRMLF